jgi:hypothetical protein
MATSTTLLVVSFSRSCRCPYPHCHPGHFPGKPKPKLPPLRSLSLCLRAALPRRPRDVSAAYGDGDMDDDFDPDDADGVDEDDNEQDYDVDYDRLLAPVVKPPPSLGPSTAAPSEEGDIAMVAAESFVSTWDSASDTVVDYAVDEDELHKIRLLHCDFLIRKVPDPDDDVFDFREVGSHSPHLSISH